MTTSADQPRTTTEGPTHAVEPWRVFAQWAAGRLGAEFVETADGFRLHRPAVESADEATPAEPIRWPLGVLSRWRREPTIPDGFDLKAGSAEELVDRLLADVAELNDRPVVVPADQPTATHEIAKRLFKAYRVDGGKVHLAGCRLEPTRLIRWSVREDNAGEAAVRHVFADEAGELLASELVDTLGLASQMADDYGRTSGPKRAAVKPAVLQEKPIEAVPTATVIALRAVGSLEVTIDGVGLTIPFNNWARKLSAPPAVCPETGRETFHLLAIDDGRVVAAEATGRCDATERRLLLSDLRTCGVTGRRLVAELGAECPVTGEWVATEQFATCPKCHESVSRVVLGACDCEACRRTEPLAADSPEREGLLAAAPILRRWKWWRRGETKNARIVEASTLWRRLVVVIDRASGRVIHAATRPRFGGAWTPVSAADVAS